MQSLGVVLARGGSKGIPRKNMVELAGRPLIQWTLDAAAASRLSRVVVSTDDAEIATFARDHGCRVIDRPAELATDTATSYAAIYHALEVLQSEGYTPDCFFRLQPTSPFRTAWDINVGLAMVECGAGAAIGVTEAARHPNVLVRMDDEHITLWEGAEERGPRQAFTPAYAITGSVYAVDVAYWREHHGMWGPRTYPVMVPPERALDIDTPFDLWLARKCSDLLLRPGRHALHDGSEHGLRASTTAA